MMNLRRLVGLVLIIFCSTSAVTTIQAQGSVPASVSGSLDFSSIKKDLAVFQGVIDTTVKNYIEGPFALLGSTKGTFLPDYGAVFNLEVNVYQIRTISPFDLRPHTDKELNEAYNRMMQRIESLKGLLVKAIGEHGSSVQQLKPEDNLTLIVHFFGADGDGKRNFPSQLVLNVKKSVIQAYRENKMSLEEMTKNVRVLQF